MSFDWPMVRLGDFCEKIGSGATPKGGKSVYLDAGKTSFIRSQNIYNEGFKVDGLAYITEEAADRLKNVSIKTGDILINITGDSVARVCLAPEAHLPARVNQHVAIVRPFSNKMDSRFIRYFLIAPEQQRLLLTIASSGATRNALTKSHLEELEVPLPTMKIQQAIAEHLQAIDNKIELNRQINQTLEQMAQAIFKSWFVDFDPVKAKIAALEAGGSQEDATLAAMQAISGKDQAQLSQLQAENPEQYNELRTTAELFPSAMQDSELGEIPEGWEVGILDDICKFQNGFAFKSKDWVDTGFPVVKIGSVKPGFVDLTSTSFVGEQSISGLERFELASGDILVGMTGYPGEVGLVPKHDTRVYLNQRVGRISPIKDYFYTFIFLTARDRKFKAYIESQAHGSAQANVSGKAICNYKITIPTEPVMSIFSKKSIPMMIKLIELNHQSGLLANVRESILPKLFSGELSISGSELEMEAG